MTTTLTTDDIARLSVSLEARVVQFERALTKAQRDSQKATATIARQHDRAASAVERAWAKPIRLKGLDAAKTELASFRTSLLASFSTGFLGGAAAGLLTQVPGAIRNATRSLAELKAEAARAGVAVRPFQELAFAATQSKIPLDALTDALKELSLRGDEWVTTGKGSAAEAFQRLGYSVTDLGARLKDPVGLFDDVIARLKTLDKAAQIRVLDEVFGGTGGERMVTLLDDGAASLGDMRQRARELGVVLDDDVIDRAAELDRQFNEVAATIDSRVKTALVGVAGVIADMAAGLSDLESKLAEFGNATGWTTLRRFMGVSDENAARGNLRFQLQRGATNVPDYSSIKGGTSVPTEINITPDKLAGLEDKFESAVRQMVADAKAAGHDLTVTSGLRSTERQRQLWQEALIKYGSPAEARKHVAPPGSSRHEKGEAVDIAFPNRTAREWVAANMGAYGLAAPVPGERPLDGRHAHLEMAGSRTGGRSKATTEADRQAEAIRRVIDSLKFEQDQLSRSELDQRINNELRAAGVDVTSEAGRVIAEETRALYEKERALDAATRAQEDANAAAEEGTQAAKDFTSTLLHGLKDGKSFSESLGLALERLSDQMLDSAINSLFRPGGSILGMGAMPGGTMPTGTSAAPTTSGGGDLFSTLFSAAGSLFGAFLGAPAAGAPMMLAGGGAVSGPGGPTSDKVLAMLSDGEFVVRASAARRYGDVLRAMNSGRLRHFGAGGAAHLQGGGARKIDTANPVPPSTHASLAMADIAAARNGAVRGASAAFRQGGARQSKGGGAVSLSLTTQVDARGSQMRREDFEAIIARNNRQLEQRIPSILQRYQIDRAS